MKKNKLSLPIVDVLRSKNNKEHVKIRYFSKKKKVLNPNRKKSKYNIFYGNNSYQPK